MIKFKNKDCDLNDEGCTILNEVLKKSKLKKINLGCNKIIK
jgi:hypothetical protein